MKLMRYSRRHEPSALARMGAFLDERNRGSQGNRNVYAKSAAGDARTREERRRYRRYQEYFGVPDEI